MDEIEIGDFEMCLDFELELLVQKIKADPTLKRLYRYTYWRFRLSLRYRMSKDTARLYALKVLTAFLNEINQE